MAWRGSRGGGIGQVSGEGRIAQGYGSNHHRKCTRCGKRLTRWKTETSAAFKVRETCGVRCWLNGGQKRAKLIEILGRLKAAKEKVESNGS